MDIDKDKSLSADVTELRRHAEERLQAKTAALHPPRTEEELQRLVHKLEVYQIELEMQNEELCRAKEELELSRNTYAELFDFAPVGYFIFDEHGVIREVNLAGAQLLAIERRMLANKPFTGFIAEPDEREIFSRHLETVLQKQGMQKCTIRLTGKESTVIYGQLQSVMVDTIKSKDGHILCSIVDGTVGKQLETEIQDAREYAENIVETVREPLVVLNSDLKILTANHSFYDTFKVTPLETIGNFIYDLGNRQWDIPKLRVLFDEILPNDTVFNGYEVEHDFQDIGHKIILLNARQIFRENIGSHIILMAMEDITERKLLAGELQKAHDKLEVTVHERTSELTRANVQLSQEIEVRKKGENSLREQEHELSTIFENAPFMMLLLDKERRVYRMNALASSFTGSSTADMIDQRIGVVLHCLHVKDSPADCGFGPRCQQCKITQTVVDTYKTGLTHHPLETNLAISIDEKEQEIIFLLSTSRVNVKNLPMVLLSLQDITEHRKLESQFLQSQKMESIGTFAGGIAHDFNNILTVIIGFGQMTIMNMSGDHPHRQNLEQILLAADRAAHLTRDLLLFSRKHASDKKTIDLNDVIRSLQKFLVRVIGEDISCKTVLADKTMPVFADAHHLEQVLMNLATNARDSMTKGGEFTIAIEQIHLDQAFIATNGFGNPGMYALLSVTDTGTGMDEETRQHIFDPFFTTKEVGKGTGLGLSVIFGIVKDHDGYINVYSEPGIGTTFRIYLPLIAPMAGKSEMKPDEEHSDTGTETILLAEDDESVRIMAVTLLEKFGYEVIVAVDGEDAVQKYLENREKIQLLLFDLIMPKKNGKDAYDEISEITPNVKVIFASGYTPETIQQKGLVDSNMSLTTKPFSPKDLLKKIRNVLDENDFRQQPASRTTP